MGTEDLEQAYKTTRGILANVRPDQLDDASTCESWKVRDVINHVVNGSHWFGATMDVGEAPAPYGDDYAGGDYLKAFDEYAKSTTAEFNKPGALEKTVKLPFGEFPGQMFLRLATSDVFTHGWDVAKSTGQNTNLDPQLAQQLLETARVAIPDQFRGPDGEAPFGPKVDCDDSAPVADQLAAFLGRQP